MFVETAGLTKLYRRYAAWLQRRLRQPVSAEEAADAVQETYLRLASRSVEDVRHPRALLLAIATNILRDAQRKARNAKHATALIGAAHEPLTSAFPEAALVRTVETMGDGCRENLRSQPIEGAQVRGLKLEVRRGAQSA